MADSRPCQWRARLHISPEQRLEEELRIERRLLLLEMAEQHRESGGRLYARAEFKQTLDATMARRRQQLERKRKVHAKKPRV